MKLNNFFTPTIIITLIVSAIALGGYKFIVQATASTVEIHTGQISTLNDKTNIIDNKVGKLETEIPNIKESISRIETSQIETQKDIKLLLRQSKIQ